MSRGPYQPRNQTVRRVLERCKTRGPIEIIDVEKGNDDVVILDNAESSHQGSRGLGASRRNSCPDDVINIDDEDGDDRNVHVTASSNSPGSEQSQNDEYLMSSGKRHCRTFESWEPKRKKDHDAAPSVNHFGFSSSTEGDSSESDSSGVDSSESIGSDGSNSDCEIIEDSSGSIRQQWERAALKKKMVDRGCLGSEDGSYSSGSSVGAGLPSERAAQSKLNADNTDFDVNTTTNGSNEPELTSETCSHIAKSTAEARTHNMKSGDLETVLDSSQCNLNVQLDPKIKDDGIGSLNKGKEVLTATAPVSNGLHVDKVGLSSACSAHGKIFSGESTVLVENKHIPEPEASTSGIAGCQEKEKVAFEQPSLSNNQLLVHSNLICEREKHKESDEYKRAVEEEWAARQRELQIQAEEAQRLRRRRKAETLRILDMEKRQKQRLEEIRQSQKKDEETINMKERLRAEVRKDLEMMELRYRDMASLLRGLGIHVGGGHFPTPNEVNVAYRKALLRFHPDRAARSDIQQQVKAEETFKLISRLKDKLMPVL